MSRASDDDAAKKLRLAGADRVIQPYSTAGREMAKLVLKPQVAAFLDVVSQTGNPEMRFEEIEVTTGCPQAGKSIRDLRVREVTGAMIIALRKGDGSFDTTPAPDAVLEARRRPHRRRHTRRGAPPRRALRSGRGDGPVSIAVERLAGALAGLAGAPVELERPSDAAHGDYATNVALRLAPTRKVAPRELAQELADRATEWPDVERAEVAGPGFLNLFLATAWYGEALAEILERGADFGSGSAAAPERVQVELVSANPTGPLTVGSARNGAYGDSVARLLEFAGHTVGREYYYNDAGAQMERFRLSVEARRKGEPIPEDGYQGEYIDELAQVDGDPVPAMLERIEATLERFRVHIDVWTRESVLQERLDETLALMDTYTSEGALWVRSEAHGDDKDRVLVRSPERGGLATYEASDAIYIRDKFERGFEHLIYVLGYDHQGVANWYRTLARMLRLRRVEGGGAALPARPPQAGRRDGEDGEALRERRLPRRPARRDRRRRRALVPRLARARAADRHRRRPRGGALEPEPVYYVQYAHARIAGILRNAEGAAVRRRCRLRRSRPEEKELVKRLADFPGVVAEATERRGPHAIPTYLVRRRGRLPPLLPPPQGARDRRSRRSGSGSAGVADGDRARPRPDRSRGARAHVASRADAMEPRARRARRLLGPDLADRRRTSGVGRSSSSSSASSSRLRRSGSACVVAGRRDLLRVDGSAAASSLASVALAVHWLTFFAAIKLSSIAVGNLTTYTAPIVLAVVAPFLLPERRSVDRRGGGRARRRWPRARRDSPAGTRTQRRPGSPPGCVSALSLAAVVIFTKQLGGLHPLAILFWSYVVIAVVTAPALPFAGRLVPHGREIAWLLVLGLVFTAGSG